MSSTAYCPSCKRTVYLAEPDQRVCPVCASPLAEKSEFLPEAAAERIVENEALFRRVNEVTADPERWTQQGDKIGFVCECGQKACTQMVYMARDDYEHVRSSPVTFLTVPGHEIPAVEIVREQRDGYQLVEKVGPPSRIAEAEAARDRA